MSAPRFLTLTAIVVLLGLSAPAYAALTNNSLSQNALSFNALTANALTSNALTQNALTQNALTSNALTSNSLAANSIALDAPVATGSAISDLNGVTVEGILLPPPCRP
jgi:hypothetical protein